MSVSGGSVPVSVSENWMGKIEGEGRSAMLFTPCKRLCHQSTRLLRMHCLACCKLPASVASFERCWETCLWLPLEARKTSSWRPSTKWYNEQWLSCSTNTHCRCACLPALPAGWCHCELDHQAYSRPGGAQAFPGQGQGATHSNPKQHFSTSCGRSSHPAHTSTILVSRT